MTSQPTLCSPYIETSSLPSCSLERYSISLTMAAALMLVGIGELNKVRTSRDTPTNHIYMHVNFHHLGFKSTTWVTVRVVSASHWKRRTHYVEFQDVSCVYSLIMVEVVTVHCIQAISPRATHISYSCPATVLNMLFKNQTEHRTLLWRLRFIHRCRRFLAESRIIVAPRVMVYL